MKKFLATLSFVFIAILCANAQTTAPKLEFEATTIDYGTIDKGSDKQRIFKFTNTGNAPLIISNAKGSCGCTVPVWPKDPIQAGQTGEIKVNYDTNRVGKFTKTVTLTTNADPTTTVLRIKGEVLPPPPENN